jgi:hypothetical protein
MMIFAITFLPAIWLMTELIARAPELPWHN